MALNCFWNNGFHKGIFTKTWRALVYRFSLEAEVGLSDGSEFEFIPDISYDISTKGTKLSFPNNLPVLELRANKVGFLDLFR